jgi:cysteine synthase
MVKLTQKRMEKYQELESRIGDTPLVKYIGDVPNGNTVWIKRECDNPFGSHYDRVYLGLYRDWEENRGLAPRMNVLETTSGSAGVSFAGIGKELGYNCYVMIPEGAQLQKRREAIEEQGATLILTPEDEYINGFPSRVRQYISELRAKFLNHSMGRKGTNNEVTLQSLEGIAREVLAEIPIDIYVGGVGNGSSIVGPGRIFKEYGTQIIGYKPAKSGKNELPGLINQDSLDSSVVIPFPHIVEANKLMDRVMLVSDWNRGVENHNDIGKTGRAGISVALDVAKEVSGKNLLVIGYDKMKRY